MTLDNYAEECHKANAKWWVNIETGEPLVRNKSELLMLAVTEIAEAVEGERKNLMDDKLPHRKMAEVEIVDFLIRMFDFFGGFKLTFSRNLFFDCPDLNHYVTRVFAPSQVGDQLRINNKGEYLMGIVNNVSAGDTAFRAGNVYMAEFHLTRAVLKALLYAGVRGFDLQGAYTDKMLFNSAREDHKHEARRMVGGKEF